MVYFCPKKTLTTAGKQGSQPGGLVGDIIVHSILYSGVHETDCMKFFGYVHQKKKKNRHVRSINYTEPQYQKHRTSPD